MRRKSIAIHMAHTIVLTSISKPARILKHILIRFLQNIISKKVPKLHTSLKDLIARLLVFLSNFLTFGWHQICTLDHILQANIRKALKKFNILILLHGITRCLNQCQILLKNRRN